MSVLDIFHNGMSSMYGQLVGHNRGYEQTYSPYCHFYQVLGFITYGGL